MSTKAIVSIIVLFCVIPFARMASSAGGPADVNLPDDMTARLSVRQVQISGNTSITNEELLADLPAIYNVSDEPLSRAESQYLYDFRVLQEIISDPGAPRQVSLRTVQGFTRYLLSVYQRRNYAGVYVYVPEPILKGEVALVDGILVVKVLEAPISEIGIQFYDANQTEVEKGYLRRSAIEAWSPVEPNSVANKKKLDDFVNLLNLSPDRYVAAVVTKGAEPNTLALKYNIYETDPWHYFIHVDNSGTNERQWAPRVGLINTSLLGIDDKFAAMYQAKPDSTIEENYSLYGTYDFPLCGPRLRLNLFGGYSEFDIDPEAGPINFLGSGTFYGGALRYNVCQTGGWFFDLIGSMSHEESKITPTLFPEFLKSDVKMDLWGAGFNVHRKDDRTTTSVDFTRIESMGGSDREEFNTARSGADPDFVILTASANHSATLDQHDIQHLRGTVRWVESNERLVPAKMTAFGGMYSVRGYDEYEFIADGGLLFSVQYEYDIIKHMQIDVPEAEKSDLRKVAPLVFFDYGRAKIEDPLPTEKRFEELFSVGVGTIVEIGKNFVGAVYYGHPLTPTDDTREGKGRVNVSFMWRH